MERKLRLEASKLSPHLRKYNIITNQKVFTRKHKVCLVFVLALIHSRYSNSMGNGTSDLTQEEIKDLVSKSHLTEAEIAQLKGTCIRFFCKRPQYLIHTIEKFDSHDVDHSGALDSHEFKTVWGSSPMSALTADLYTS